MSEKSSRLRPRVIPGRPRLSSIVPPTASISVGPLEGIAPLEGTLTDASYGGEDPAASLDIDWGDGTSDLGAGLGSTTTHTYMAGSWTPSASVTNAAGVGVIIEAQHMCMMMRGVEKQNSMMKTSMMLGQFQGDQSTRMEFLSLLELRR